MNATGNNPHRPWGWIFALAVALLFATVILGVIAIGLIEKRKQRLYRLRGAEAPALQQTNTSASSTIRPGATNVLGAR